MTCLIVCLVPVSPGRKSSDSLSSRMRCQALSITDITPHAAPGACEPLLAKLQTPVSAALATARTTRGPGDGKTRARARTETERVVTSDQCPAPGTGQPWHHQCVQWGGGGVQCVQSVHVYTGQALPLPAARLTKSKWHRPQRIKMMHCAELSRVHRPMFVPSLLTCYETDKAPGIRFY